MIPTKETILEYLNLPKVSLYTKVSIVDKLFPMLKEETCHNAMFQVFKEEKKDFLSKCKDNESFYKELVKFEETYLIELVKKEMT